MRHQKQKQGDDLLALSHWIEIVRHQHLLFPTYLHTPVWILLWNTKNQLLIIKIMKFLSL